MALKEISTGETADSPVERVRGTPRLLHERVVLAMRVERGVEQQRGEIVVRQQLRGVRFGKDARLRERQPRERVRREPTATCAGREEEAAMNAVCSAAAFGAMHSMDAMRSLTV